MSLPPIYQQVRRFLATVEQELATGDHKIVITEIEQFIAEIPPNFEELEPLARSLGVEIHKQFHLLRNDLSFWYAARQMETKAQRWQTIQQRLTTLNLYVQQLLSLEESPRE